MTKKFGAILLLLRTNSTTYHLERCEKNRLNLLVGAWWWKYSEVEFGVPNLFSNGYFSTRTNHYWCEKYSGAHWYTTQTVEPYRFWWDCHWFPCWGYDLPNQGMQVPWHRETLSDVFQPPLESKRETGRFLLPNETASNKFITTNKTVATYISGKFPY